MRYNMAWMTLKATTPAKHDGLHVVLDVLTSSSLQLLMSARCNQLAAVSYSA